MQLSPWPLSSSVDSSSWLRVPGVTMTTERNPKWIQGSGVRPESAWIEFFSILFCAFFLFRLNTFLQSRGTASRCRVASAGKSQSWRSPKKQSTPLHVIQTRRGLLKVSPCCWLNFYYLWSPGLVIAENTVTGKRTEYHLRKKSGCVKQEE